ncbi:MAG: TolC family protein [Bacteroidota bacterium]
MKKAIFVLMVTAISATAQSKLPLTVEKAIQLGLENSKALHSSLMKVEYADAKAGETNASRLPSLKFGGAYTRLSDVPPFNIGPFPPILTTPINVSPAVLNNYNLKLSFTQPLFTGFRMDALSAAADYSAEAQNFEYSKDRSDLIYNVRVAYWSLYKAIQIKKVIDENVEQVRAHLKDVQNLMVQGMTTNNDVLKVQVQLSDAQLKQIDASNGVRLAMIALNNTIGIPLTIEIDLESKVVHQPKDYGDLNKLIEQAMERRPELKAMDSRVKAGEAGVTAAKSGWFPQIYLSGNYYYSRPNQRLFPTQDIFKDTWDVSVGVSLDIWNWGTTLHQTDQAQAQLAQARDAVGQIQDGITLELTQSYLNVQQAKERITVADQGVKQAEENYRVTNKRFNAGLVSTSEMLDAEVALLQAKTSQTNALVDYEISQARIEKAIGG